MNLLNTIITPIFNLKDFILQKLINQNYFAFPLYYLIGYFHY